MNQTQRLGAQAGTPGSARSHGSWNCGTVPDVRELGVTGHVVEPENQRSRTDAVMPPERVVRV
jgi:hypothetical protein